MEFNPEFARKIDAFRQGLGNEFMGFVRYFKTQQGREASIKYMVLKGLKQCPGHDELSKELRLIMEKDLETINSNLDTNNFQDAGDLLREWGKNISDQENIANSLPGEPVSEIFLNFGKLYLKEKNYSKALTNFKKALNYSPLNPDIHFIIIDTFFVAEDFNGAIGAINQAIKVDKQFAAYWETIGDSLRAEDQYEDAILAYERCFIYLPENINLLKKIGECYLATNQLESAKTAFEQLKVKINDFDLNSK
jgi:tetratricopeptide (TPR) repeat protein